MNPKSRLHWYDFLAINLFWLGLNIRNTALGSVFMPYLVDAFAPQNIKNTALGELRTAGLVIAMLVQPAAGLLSDRSTSRFGRRRPYIFVGVLLDLVFFVFIAISTNYWTLLVAVLLIQFSSNVSHGPLQALIPDQVPENQRGMASAVKSLFELAPLILVGLTIAPLVASGHLQWAIAAAAGALLLTMLMTVWWVKEEPLAQKPDLPFWPPMLRVLGMLAGLVLGALAGLVGGGLLGALAGLIALPFTGSRLALVTGVGVGGGAAMLVAVVAGVWAGALGTLGADARRQSSFTWWVVNRLLFLAAITSIQSFAPFFLMYAFHIDRDAAAGLNGGLVTMVGVFTLLTALPSGWLSDRLGPRRLVTISGLVAAVGGFLLLAVIWAPQMALIYVVGAILGMATGLFMTANWAMGAGLVPSQEAGRYLGVSNLAGAGAGIIGTGIGGPVADYLNSYSPGLGYFAVFAVFALMFALSTVSMLGIRHTA